MAVTIPAERSPDGGRQSEGPSDAIETDGTGTRAARASTARPSRAASRTADRPDAAAPLAGFWDHPRPGGRARPAADNGA